MMADELIDPVEAAFASGATSVTIRRRSDGRYGASISAFMIQVDGKRSACSSATADGDGATPADAIRDAIAQLPSGREPEAVEQLEAVEPEPENTLPAKPREVLTPEVMDPKLRYAVVGRPGEFVTREEAQGRR